MIYGAQSIIELIGKTPVVALKPNPQTPNVQLYAKLEYFNPSGSIKDRAALGMYLDALDHGLINPKTTIIEPTSGNTGVGLAMIAAIRGHRCIIVMPETMTIERRRMMMAYGAEVELTPGHLGMSGAIARAQTLAKEISNSWIANQFSNPANPHTHEQTTAREIWETFEGKIDGVIAGIGTGGTISGLGRALKKLNPEIKIFGYEPANSPAITEGKAGPHRIQGIGAGFIPDNYQSSVVTEVFRVKDEDAIAQAVRLARQEGLFVGISSGGAYSAMLQAAQYMTEGQRLLAIFPDNGMRYLSTGIYDPAKQNN